MDLKSILFGILLLITAAPLIFSQTTPMFGLVWDDTEVIESLGRDTVPIKFRGDELPVSSSLKLFCPIPQDQGLIASCVGHALAHALSMQRAIGCGHLKLAQKTADLHSAAFIYNQIKLGDDCLSGAHIISGLQLLKSQGDCFRHEFTSSPNDCRKQPRAKVRSLAYSNRIKAFYPSFNNEMLPEDKLERIKATIYAGYPLIVSLEVPINLRDIGLHPIHVSKWKQSKKAGHAMVVIGYNDDTGYLALINSFGASWNGDGLMYLPYELIELSLRYGFWMDIGALGDCK